MARRSADRFSTPADEPQLTRADRRTRGVYYTPPQIVRLILDLTLQPLLARRREDGTAPCILDPACGAGEFLIEAYQRLVPTWGPAAARRSIFGIDNDRAAVALARQRLLELESDESARYGAKVGGNNLRVADALRHSPFASASFDVVVGNPPYINIRQLAKTLPPKRITALRERFRTARGNFDLYVLFIERAIELLREGGRCGLIVPNKWATLDYARACRELLLAQATIEHVVDLSATRAFKKASVYPHVLVFRKEPPQAGHFVQCGQLAPRDPLVSRSETTTWSGRPRHVVPQRAWSADAISLVPTLDVESRAATVPLGQLAKLSCGTAGYAAQRVARRLIDGHKADLAHAADSADFITSGNIDRYCIRLGNVRYLNRLYRRPWLPLDVPELTAAKRRLFTQPKIVIAGMSRRLEAAWDERGLALGVQVFAASEWQVDPYYLLALLNSKLLSYLFATRFAAKRLAGGYLAINKGQLARLPIRAIAADRGEQRRFDRLSELAATWGRFLTCHANGLRRDRQVENLPHEEEADRLVYELYRLSDDEIARIEGYFSNLSARAA